MRIRFTKAPTFTKAVIASAVFAFAYLASTSNVPSCSDSAAVFASGSGKCLERYGFLHTASGWLALACLVAAVVLLALKHKDSILEPQEHQGPPVPVPGRAPDFCARCGTRIIAGDRFCQGCGASAGSL